MEKKKTLFADDMILYVENPKDNTRKLQVLISEYNNIAGYKINTQKSSEKVSSDSISMLNSFQAREAVSKLRKPMP